MGILSRIAALVDRNAGAIYMSHTNQLDLCKKPLPVTEEKLNNEIQLLKRVQHRHPELDKRIFEIQIRLDVCREPKNGVFLTGPKVIRE